MNRQLHRERIVRGSHQRRLHEGAWTDLPDGTFVDLEGSPWLVTGGQLAQWTPEGYQSRRLCPTAGLTTVITPPSSVAVLRAGYPVEIHPSAAPPTAIAIPR